MRIRKILKTLKNNREKNERMDVSNVCQLSNPEHPVLKCKLWTIDSFCTQRVSQYWFGVKFLWLKDIFCNTVTWCITKLFKI